MDGSFRNIPSPEHGASIKILSKNPVKYSCNFCGYSVTIKTIFHAKQFYIFQQCSKFRLMFMSLAIKKTGSMEFCRQFRGLSSRCGTQIQHHIPLLPAGGRCHGTGDPEDNTTLQNNKGVSPVPLPDHSKIHCLHKGSGSVQGEIFKKIFHGDLGCIDPQTIFSVSSIDARYAGIPPRILFISSQNFFGKSIWQHLS